jgi:hypothetical protein
MYTESEVYDKLRLSHNSITFKDCVSDVQEVTSCRDRL